MEKQKVFIPVESLEDDKLIAEFLELKKSPNREAFLYQKGWYGYKEFLFHSSWDWLMPAWKKFISLTFESVSERHYHNQVKQIAIKSLSDADIDNFFKDIVMAIKWYNQQSESLNIK